VDIKPREGFTALSFYSTPPSLSGRDRGRVIISIGYKPA